jgi:Uma2 family endonuclease
MTRVLSQPVPPQSFSRQPPLDLDDVQHIVLEDASWELYERLLRDIGDRPIRITHDQGKLEMMSPLPERERPKKIIGRMIEAMSVELGMEVASLGSTTFRRRDKARGLEPDECYYFKHERQMRGRRRLNLKKDPPPELVVEIDITHRSIEREPIYAVLGVPEIWRWDGMQLQCLLLASDGAYHVRARSLAFPALAPADLTRFIRMRGRVGENAIVRKFLEWVREGGLGGKD